MQGKKQVSGKLHKKYGITAGVSCLYVIKPYLYSIYQVVFPYMKLIYNSMKVAVLTTSKFFHEAIRFIFFDRLHYMFVSDSVANLLNQLSQRKYDIILVDLDSFNEDKDQVIKKLKAIENTSSKVVLFSFDPEKAVDEFNREIRVDLFVHRPLNPPSIKRELTTLDIF